MSPSWPPESGRHPRRGSRVVLLYQANPVASSARAEAAREALARVPLDVSFSPFLDESARYANLVLPDHTYLERWQDALAPPAVPFPVWTVVRPVVKPLHGSRATGDVILDLARRVGGDAKQWSRWSSVEEIIRERGLVLAGARRGSAFVEAFRQDELRELEARGWWLPHGQAADEYWGRESQALSGHSTRAYGLSQSKAEGWYFGQAIGNPNLFTGGSYPEVPPIDFR